MFYYIDLMERHLQSEIRLNLPKNITNVFWQDKVINNSSGNDRFSRSLLGRGGEGWGGGERVFSYFQVIKYMPILIFSCFTKALVNFYVFFCFVVQACIFDITPIRVSLGLYHVFHGHVSEI